MTKTYNDSPNRTTGFTPKLGSVLKGKGAQELRDNVALTLKDDRHKMRKYGEDGKGEAEMEEEAGVCACDGQAEGEEV